MRTRIWLLAGTLFALTATAGSLFFSLGLGLYPCDLCWYQRILMYPLVPILGVAAYEERVGVYRTALPLAVAGLALATYHSYIQRAGTDGFCSVGGSCATIQWTSPILDLTIPNLSLVGFALVTLTLVGMVRQAASAGSSTSPVSG
ncbi:disulfide bond formation protein B [Halomarina ordinaria]|uniref:Disulfide bond formation protein B n=1 Tax=Halomarina ordinaria TaxID=3033939 RepID=A0ABD5UE28_9EURY|nr:disulfide bond formation protein B [Halomarina sp. PSRA2]